MNRANPTTPARTQSVAVGQYTSAGRKPLNQDSMAARVPTGAEAQLKGVALAVADGISSSAISQVAAETAVKALVTDYYATPEAWTVKTAAARVIEATNSWLYAQNRHARTSDLNRGLVCTLSALVLRGCDAHLFQVGDSRVARWRAGELDVLTFDHTAVLSETERYLGRALGAQHRVEIDYHRVPVQTGDLFLLTTDGVHDFVSGSDVQRALAASGSLDEVAQMLAQAALANGSGDNLTVSLLRIDALPDVDEVLALSDAELPLPGALAPGERIDGFTLLREIHNTYRSRLLLARDNDGAHAVLKLPGPETGADPAYLQRFLFEEWVARRVESPHLIKAASGGGPRTARYVAMRWIDGMTLRQWQHDHPQPTLEEVRDLASQIARGLRALHRQEMIHQDLRPENVMLDRDGTAILIDLGSVAVAGLDEAAPGVLGAMPGTFQYTAPEYLSGDSVTWRADQYALGVIVYELLTGKLPYGAQVARVRSRRDQQRLRYRSAHGQDRAVPPWVDFALARACHRDPARRYDALSEFLADLRTPSARFKAQTAAPLLERHPVRVWQVLTLLQTLVIIALIARWPS